MMPRMWLAPTPRFTATLAAAPAGRAQVFDTLRRMRRYITKGRTDARILQAATNIVYLTPPKDKPAELRALFEYVRDCIRYQQDVHGVETLAEPHITLARGVGDCDDQATLLCALAEAIGYPTRLVAAAYESGEYEHVFCQVFDGSRWIDCDPTERGAMGYSPPGAVRLHFEAL